MKKQPYLTGFPRTVIANSARRFQAAIRQQRNDLLTRSPDGYSNLFQGVLPSSFLNEIDPTNRQRHYGHIPTFWAWISQVLEGNTSCSKALSFIQSWCVSNELPAPASDSSSYCKARKRITEAFLNRVNEKVIESLREEELWNGMTLKAIDGSSLKLMDTPANQKDHPQPSSQKPGCGFPVMNMAGLLNLSHGGWEAFQIAKGASHDITMAEPLLEHLQQGDLLLADRAYCSYRFLSAIRQQGAHALVRLHQKRDKALDWRHGRRIGKHQRIVTWKRPMYSNVSKIMTRYEWETLPESMELRLIRMSYQDRYGAKRNMTVATTLTDENTYDGIELHQLYARRWEIEVRLREIKTTMGFEFLRVRSPEMARKSMQMIQIAYNLLRILMQQAAKEAGISYRAISFKGILDLITSMSQSLSQARKMRYRMRQMIVLASQRLLNHRPYRSEPRAIKQRLKPFSLLTLHRSTYTEIPHRSNYRACA